MCGRIARVGERGKEQQSDADNAALHFQTSCQASLTIVLYITTEQSLY